MYHVEHPRLTVKFEICWNAHMDVLHVGSRFMAPSTAWQCKPPIKVEYELTGRTLTTDYEDMCRLLWLGCGRTSLGCGCGLP